MMLPLILYHGKCNDGFAAAWVAHQYFKGDCELIPVMYNEPPPDAARATGSPRDILILDFSYPRSTLITLAATNNSVTVLDHHKTAALDLALLPSAPSIYEWEEKRTTTGGFNFPLTVKFDMAYSGAGLAWDWFHPDQPRPSLIDYVEDRDLWRFADHDTRAVHAALSSYPYDVGTWTALAAQMEEPASLKALISEGEALDRKHLQLCHQIIEHSRRDAEIGGHVVPLCAAPYEFASDIGNLMSVGYSFAATYVEHAGGRTFSLRSQKGATDVSAIAKRYGGGGHANAAGFTIPASEPVYVVPVRDRP